MTGPVKPLWPYSARASVLLVPAILFGLMAFVGVIQSATEWPSGDSERLVLIGVFALSLLPILLATLDALATQGGTIEFKGLKVDFARMARSAPDSASVAANIGVSGEAVTDSSTTQILEVLERAMRSEVVVVDLEDGQAWWETRLIVLLAGARRLGMPSAVVFVATKGGKKGQYLGWGTPTDLLEVLLRADPLYRELYDRTAAAAAQWALVEPPAGDQQPNLPTWVTGLAQWNFWMAFQGPRRNPLAREQLLASELGSSVESDGPRPVGVGRLEELFVSVLRTKSIDSDAPAAEQVAGFLNESAEFVAVTTDGAYLQLVERTNAIAAILASVERQASG